MASDQKAHAVILKQRSISWAQIQSLVFNRKCIPLFLALVVLVSQLQWPLKPSHKPRSFRRLLAENLPVRSGSAQASYLEDLTNLQLYYRGGDASCRFLPHWTPAEGKPDTRLRHQEDACNQEESCTTQLERVCLTRKDPNPPVWNATVFRTGNPFLEVRGLGSECAGQGALAALFGGASCGRVGKRLPLTFSGKPIRDKGHENMVKWKPKTFIIYCAQEGCDYNFFHSIALAYYSTYVAIRKLGLEDLRGIHVEFYECQSGNSEFKQIKSPEFIAAARERHTLFLEAFKPASISFMDVGLQNQTQFWGCYESVVFVGHNEFPWHCRTTSTEIDPTLTGFANFIQEAVGFRDPPDLPTEEHLVYFKRETLVRTLVNTDEIEAALTVPYTVFTGADPKLSFRAQLKEFIRVSRGASIIFGGHGAGLTNVLFAPRNAVLIEVTNCFFRIPLYRNLAVLTGKYYLELVSASVLLGFLICFQTSFAIFSDFVRWASGASSSSLDLCRLAAFDQNVRAAYDMDLILMLCVF
jgi:hypothetical protein